MEKNKNTTTAKRLRQALDNAKMTQQELSNKSGVPKSSISQYVHGRFVPQNKYAGAMAKVLNVNPAWLIGFNVPMSEDLIDLTTLSEEHRKALLDYYNFLLRKEIDENENQQTD